MDEGGGGKEQHAKMKNSISTKTGWIFFFNRADGIALIERDLKRWGGNEKVAITR